ncbi:MAG: site-specific DNA-methyltransferase [Bacteroides sp.]|nr:site-specific DNA-methyltransferase [Bacteroides sp.]
MDKLRMKTPDAVYDNVAKIAALFPHCVTECKKILTGTTTLKIDWDKLRAELDPDVIQEGEERYQFTWPDKRAASRLANTPTDKTLRPDVDASKDFWNTKNLYIEGDNLDVLKVLRENYLGKIKMIYIDPPYNTGNDFVYNDDFAQSREEFEQSSGLFDEDGNQVIDPMQRNTESNGRFHTDWLNMIYPRLKVARDLLSDDGVIFISIDGNEYENLHKLCSEIFGQRNVIGSIIVQSNPRGSMSSAEIAELHEYVILCSKNRDLSAIIGHKLTDEMISEYKHSDLGGKYRLLGLRMRGGFWRRSDRPKLYFPLFINPISKEVSLTKDESFSIQVFPIQISTGEEGTWRWSKEKIATERNYLVGKQITRDGENVWDIFQKDYLTKNGERRTKAKSIWNESEMNYQNGTNDIKSLLGNSKLFEYSKPTFLINQMLEMIDTKDSIILDFFSGSATTAHAVMKLNAEDGGKRKFIMVQLPEVTDEKSEARKAGYETICQIGKERIRRAGDKVKEEAGDNAKDLDVGFRVLKLDSSNMEDVFYIPEDFNEQHLFNYVDNVKSDRTPLDLLFQVLPELGIELSAKIEERDVNGKKVFFVDGTYLIATFDTDVNESTVTEIAKMKPDYFVMRDASAANDNVLDNFEQIFKHYSPDTIRKIL